MVEAFMTIHKKYVSKHKLLMYIVNVYQNTFTHNILLILMTTHLVLLIYVFSLEVTCQVQGNEKWFSGIEILNWFYVVIFTLSLFCKVGMLN